MMLVPGNCVHAQSLSSRVECVTIGDGLVGGWFVLFTSA